MNLRELFNRKKTLLSSANEIKAQLKEVDKEIVSQVQEEFEKTRKKNDKHFGAITLNIDGFDVKQTIQKKVEWDQEYLLKAYEEMKASGIDPYENMSAKFTVAEKDYAKMPEDKKRYFAKARTEKQGTVNVEIVEK